MPNLTTGASTKLFCSINVAKLFILAAILISYHTAFSQSSELKDYLILGGDTTCVNPSECGVNISSSNSNNGGVIGSYQSIKTFYLFNHSGDLFSTDNIDLFTDATVQGTIWCANKNQLKQNALTAGHRANLEGDLFINGNTMIYPGVVKGKVTHPFGSVYTGPTPLGGEVLSTPSFNPLPNYPAVNIFPPSSNNHITHSQILIPGLYGSLMLPGEEEITFTGPGDYVFSKIENTGYVNTFVFDFQNTSSGDIRLFIHGDVDLGKIDVKIINGGDASRILAETHGTGSTSSNGKTAWQQAPGWIGQDLYTHWKGTVWAPYGNIQIGTNTSRANFTGALYSPKLVQIGSGVTGYFAPYLFCDSMITISFSAPDTITCSNTTTVIQANTSATNASFHWNTPNGTIVSGVNSLTPTVSEGGIYTLTVSYGNGCSKSASILVPEKDCVIPYYPPPVDGKTRNIIGSELTSLSQNTNYNDTAGHIFLIDSSNVYIEVITIKGQYQNALNLLQTPAYGLTNIIDNGPASLLITGLFPIYRLPKLDSLPHLINYVRPLFPPVVNSGIALTQGDAAINGSFVRMGYDVSGKGVKIGVLSNSFNTLPGNPAQTDVANEDLPGIGNPNNPTPVEVLQDFPFGVQSDEGRAMLQIIHDIAPKANLAFRTGYLSAGNMAKGINELADESCDIIVDDITYITEPFFSDGVISRTVNAVRDSGITYFTSAGNFGNKAYSSNFNPNPAPTGITGQAHDFGGGDVFQSISLQPGNYTIVLQWQDSVYSIGQSSGTINDLDIYLTDDFGNTLFGFNRDNLGQDPIEIMPFTVTQATQSNILIVRAAGTQNVLLKYVVFQGNMTINEYQTGTSTIVGHANSEGAIAVGSVNYNNTPSEGVSPPLIDDYSSLGGTPVEGIVRNKPEFVAPNGGNTTVFLGGPNNDGDVFPNFYGTSAAAPHAAGVSALVKAAKTKFDSISISPDQMKTLLSNTAIDMGSPGFDYASGYGLIQADQAVLTFANPAPTLTQIKLDDTTQVAGIDSINISLTGDYFTSSSLILLNNDTLNTLFISTKELKTEVAPFTGNPTLRVFTPAKSSSMLDGGISDSLFFYSTPRQKVLVIADQQNKRYGEALPPLTFSVLIDSIPIDSTGYSISDVGLDSLTLTTTANTFSDVGFYLIRPQDPGFNSSNSAQAALLSSFEFEFMDGEMIVNPMPLLITAKDTAVAYGIVVNSFQFEYSIADSLVDPSEINLFLDSIKSEHQSNIANAVAVVKERASGRALVNADLLRLSFAASGRALVNARSVASGRALVNGAITYDTTEVIDIAEELVYDYQDDPEDVILRSAYQAHSSSSARSGRALVNARSMASGRALVNGYPLVNAYPLVNGYPLVNAYPLVNSLDTVADTSEVALIFDESDLDTSGTDSVIEYTPINLVSGLNVGINAIVPAAYFNPNFIINYHLGNLIITPSPLHVKPDSTTSIYGDSIILKYSVFGYHYYDSDSSLIKGSPTYSLLDSTGQLVSSLSPDAGIYQTLVDSLELIQPSNYYLELDTGHLEIYKDTLIAMANDTSKVYGTPNPVPTITYLGFKNGDSPSDILTPPIPHIQANQTSSVGNYPITLSGGSSVNYRFKYIHGTLSITPAELTISAKDAVTDQGLPFPAFKYDIIGNLIGNDRVVTPPSFQVNPTYNGQAGVFDLIPGGAILSAPANYNVSYQNGTLYVNPRGPGAKPVSVAINCIDTLQGHPLGYNYLAHFEYHNANSTPVYIPYGVYNQMIPSTNNDGNYPELYAPGKGNVDIYFDGTGLIYFIISYKNNFLDINFSYVSSNSPICKPVHKNSKAVSSNSEGESTDTHPKLYPNPATNWITFSSDEVGDLQFVLSDLSGKGIMNYYQGHTDDKGQFTIDLSDVQSGFYMLRVNSASNEYIFKLIIQ